MGVAHDRHHGPAPAALLLAVVLLLYGGPASAAPDTTVDVSSFGARCDNATTDDTEAFRQAIKAVLARSTGGTITVPTGRCRVSGPLDFQLSDQVAVKLQGAGRDLSEIVWTSDTDGVAVTVGGRAIWLRTPENPAPVFHLDGLSLVYAGSPGTGSGAAIRLTGATTAEALAPRIKLHDVGIHASENSSQSWHDGLVATNLPSGITWDDGYIVLANVAPPYRAVGAGIHIEGGPPDPAGHSRLTSSLYYFTNITIQNAHHGVEIGQGVQGIYMDRVGGNADVFLFADQPPGIGDTGSISYVNGNPSGFYASIDLSNVDYAWVANNQLQAIPGADYVGMRFLNSNMLQVMGNTLIGLPSRPKGSRGIVIDYAADVLGAYNQKLVSGNQIALMDVGVEIRPGTKNTMLFGNAFDNNIQDYRLEPDTYAVSNMRNGIFEAFASINRSAIFRHGLNLADCPSSPQGLTSGDLWCSRGGRDIHRVP